MSRELCWTRKKALHPCASGSPFRSGHRVRQRAEDRVMGTSSPGAGRRCSPQLRSCERLAYRRPRRAGDRSVRRRAARPRVVCAHAQQTANAAAGRVLFTECPRAPPQRGGSFKTLAEQTSAACDHPTPPANIGGHGARRRACKPAWWSTSSRYEEGVRAGSRDQPGGTGGVRHTDVGALPPEIPSADTNRVRLDASCA
jgi:hypothetical protein